MQFLDLREKARFELGIGLQTNSVYKVALGYAVILSAPSTQAFDKLVAAAIVFAFGVYLVRLSNSDS